ncbi:MAG: HFX_2341 family transcriptional regulator domain-containing protein [Candidatus Heimdallarchaeaceae archaeon]
MVNLHIATVGKTVDPILEGINYFPIDHLILLYNEGASKNDSGSFNEAKEIEETALKLKIKCDLKEVNLFDMEDVFTKIIIIVNKFKGANIHVNITGGTKIMSTAAFSAAFLLGLNAYYIRQEMNGVNESLADRVIELPVPKVQLDELDNNQQKILIYLLENQRTDNLGTTRISNDLELKPQLVSYHINQLEKAKLIINEKTGRSNIIRLTNAGRFAAKFFKEQNL